MPNNPPDLKLPFWLPLVLLVAMLVASCIANDAQADVVDLSGIDVGNLGKVQSQTILFNAQAERAKARRSIAENGGSSGQSGDSNTQVHIHSPVPGNSAQVTTQFQDLPVIKAITGSPRKLSATLLYKSGVEFDVVAGSSLPGNFRVSNISLEGVTVEGNGKQFLLGFSGISPSTSGSTSSPVAPALPGQF
ncbi:type IV pilus biogenesis protein PilP [Pseudomonas sp. GOM7]|uniref:type IV pilus biogenesis protein PilP n=1 Tax=Pseudomonas sp. GOM7 TaxID=2998079 RepID=UPI00227BC88B|nr:type IV pilus biogenesis protein PilP [Pseudomonas sp. GOM7]WAJ37250.1 type IV pilus biogenesis protein PilP [Pseudomonas sp. GOM7]